jgi:hypothetical protein
MESEAQPAATSRRSLRLAVSLSLSALTVSASFLSWRELWTAEYLGQIAVLPQLDIQLAFVEPLKIGENVVKITAENVGQTAAWELHGDLRYHTLAGLDYAQAPTDDWMKERALRPHKTTTLTSTPGVTVANDRDLELVGAGARCVWRSPLQRHSRRRA